MCWSLGSSLIIALEKTSTGYRDMRVCFVCTYKVISRYVHNLKPKKEKGLLAVLRHNQLPFPVVLLFFFSCLRARIVQAPLPKLEKITVYDFPAECHAEDGEPPVQRLPGFAMMSIKPASRLLFQ